MGNAFPYTNLMSDEDKKKVHDASMKMLSEIGMHYEHPKALEIAASNGVRVEGETAYWTEEQVMEWIAKAPETFTIYARNPEHNIEVGGENINIAPGYGMPTIIERDGSARPGTMQDYVNFVKMFHANPDYHTNGSLMIQPNDVDVHTSNMCMTYASLMGSDKGQLLVGEGGTEDFEAMMRALAVTVGGEEYLRSHPCANTIIDVVTPLAFSVNMTEALITFAEWGQATAISSCAMAGTTAPVSAIGPIVYTNAEVLSTIALAQMINPGCPVLYGSQSPQADMGSGQIAGGAPESALMYIYAQEMARYYHLPFRGGGAITDSKTIDTQSGYESMMTLMACYMAKTNYMIHSAGVMNGYVTTSYDKIMQDFELNRYVKRFFEVPVRVDDETIPMEEIMDCGHDGEFLTADSTFDMCREIVAPLVGSRGVVQDINNQVYKKLDAYYDKLLETYHANVPEVDESVREQVKDILCAAGTDRATLDRIDEMLATRGNLADTNAA
ncbi:MAG: trimethylamine methyltransferase family protein [Eggerthellaceae bacterium]|nr:trimethylamine methyltransferase family protein [Eggerthellaceae bacterium]